MVEETLPIKPSQMLKIDSDLRIFIWYLHHGWRNFFKSSSLICSKLTLKSRFFIDIFTVAEENFQIQLSQVLKIDSWINIFNWYLNHNWINFTNSALPKAQSWLLDYDFQLISAPWLKKIFKFSSPKCSKLTLELILYQVHAESKP